MHSKNYNKVARYYKFKMWNITQVRNAVEKGWITSSEFEQITGQVYL